MKRIVTLQDISCLGRCSLTVALPVISAMGVECTVLPTALLSTHTAFPGFTRLDLSDQLEPIASHWQALGLRVDAIYTGYLTSPYQCGQALDLIRRFRQDGSLVFVDPVMGDGGRRYTALGPDFPQAMARLCGAADIIVPNLTEACLLTGTPYTPVPSLQYSMDLLKKLLDLGCGQALLTGFSPTPSEIGVLGLGQDGASFSYTLPRQPRNFHGTGDLFASVCAGGLMNGLGLERAVQVAADFTAHAIASTKEATPFGVEFEPQLSRLWALLEAAK